MAGPTMTSNGAADRTATASCHTDRDQQVPGITLSAQSRAYVQFPLGAARAPPGWHPVENRRALSVLACREPLPKADDARRWATVRDHAGGTECPPVSL